MNENLETVECDNADKNMLMQKVLDKIAALRKLIYENKVEVKPVPAVTSH